MGEQPTEKAHDAHEHADLGRTLARLLVVTSGARTGPLDAHARALVSAVAEGTGDVCVIRSGPLVVGARPRDEGAEFFDVPTEALKDGGLLGRAFERREDVWQPTPTATRRLLGPALFGALGMQNAAGLTALRAGDEACLLVIRLEGRPPHTLAEHDLFGVVANYFAMAQRADRAEARARTLNRRSTHPVVGALRDEARTRGAEARRHARDLAQFASVVSHDLKQPLRTVSTYSDLLAEHVGDSLEGESRMALAFIREAAAHGREMVDDLLDFSRVTGDVALSFTPVSLREVVDGLLHGELAPAIAETGAEVEVEELPEIGGSEGRLRQLFANLIGNAIKFAGDHKPHIRLFCRSDGAGHEVTVEDNGIGVPEGQREAIFEVFHRLHTRDEIPGTGVGLAICRAIAELHRGHIRAEANPEGGSRFVVFLPR